MSTQAQPNSKILTLEQQGEAACREGGRMGREHRKALDEGREIVHEIRPSLMLTTEHAASSHGIPVVVDLDGNAYGPDDEIEIAVHSVADSSRTMHHVRQVWSFGGLVALAAEQSAEQDPVSEFVVNAHKFLGYDDPRS